MSTWFERATNPFIAFITRHPWLALLASACVLGACLAGAPKLRTNFTYTAFYQHDDPQLLSFQRFERTFGNDDAVVLVVHSPSGIFDAESARLLRDLTERMWQLPEVIRVDSLANFQWVHASGDDVVSEPLLPLEGALTSALLAERQRVALSHESLPGYLISDDGKTAMLYARLKPGLDGPADSERIAAKAHELVLDFQGGDHSFHLTGEPIVADAFRAVSSKDTGFLVPLLLGTVAFLLFVVFRAVAATVLPTVVILATVLAAIASSGHLGLELSSLSMSLPQVLIAVCVGDAVHLLAGFFRARKAGFTRRESAAHTLKKNLVATLLTTLTTAIGFVSFVTASLLPIRGFGLLAALGTVLAWLFTYLFVGAALTLWPGKDPARHADGRQDLNSEPLLRATPRSIGFVEWVDRHRFGIVACWLLLSVGALTLVLDVGVNSNPYQHFSRQVPVRQAHDFLVEHVSGATAFELVIDSGREDGIKDPEFLRRVERFEAEALTVPGIHKTISIVDVLRQMNRALHGDDAREYRLPDTATGVAQQLLLYTMGLPRGMDVNDRISVKSDRLRVTLLSDITDSSRAVSTGEALVRKASGIGLDAHVTGKMMLYQGMNGHVVHSFLQSLVIALLLISLIMLASFRSLRLGLISLAPNFVPPILGGAALYLWGGALDIGTVLVASVSLGIAVDNTIHILANFSRHVEMGDHPKVALSKLLAHTGPAMLWGSAIVIGGFATLALGSFVPNVYFGALTAFVLGVGVLADFLLLPALLLAIPSAATRRERAPLSVEEERLRST